MGGCNSGDHIGEDQLHKDITTRNIWEHQQKYHLGTVNNKLLEGDGRGGA